MFIPDSIVERSQSDRQLMMAGAAAQFAPPIGPIVEEDEILASRYRAETLLALSPEDAYPRFLAEPDPEKQKWIFGGAISGGMLALIGHSLETKAVSTARQGFRTLIGRVFRRLLPVELDAFEQVAAQSMGRVLDSGRDKEATDRAVREGSEAVRKLIAQYVSPVKATEYDANPVTIEAMRAHTVTLLEAGIAMINAQPWPSSMILWLTDTNQGYTARESYVRKLMPDSPELQNWYSLTQRQRGEVTRRAMTIGLEKSRLLVQGTMSLSELGSTPSQMSSEDVMLWGFGAEGVRRYQAAAEPDRNALYVIALGKMHAWTSLIWGTL